MFSFPYFGPIDSIMDVAGYFVEMASNNLVYI